MSDIHIPAASLEAGARNLCPDAFPCDICRDRARAAFEAMVGAWEGMERHTFPESGSGDDYTPALDEIILPLPPQEKPDGK